MDLNSISFCLVEKSYSKLTFSSPLGASTVQIHTTNKSPKSLSDNINENENKKDFGAICPQYPRARLGFVYLEYYCSLSSL